MMKWKFVVNQYMWCVKLGQLYSIAISTILTRDSEAHPAASVSQVQLQKNIDLILLRNVSQNEGEIWNNLKAMKVEPGVYHLTCTT
jgi:hypothetical protein